MQRFIFLLSFYFSLSTHIHAQQKVSRKSDIVYDHKDGLAFVFDVISPEKKNGAAILYILSGGWVSREASTMNTDFCKYYTDKGYTVFIITHCSQPRYNVPEIISQVQRAINMLAIMLKHLVLILINLEFQGIVQEVIFPLPQQFLGKIQFQKRSIG